MGDPRLTRLNDALAGVSSLGFDTPPFIYFIERHPSYLPVLRDVFGRIEAGAVRGYSSVITLTEVLTKPKQLRDSSIEVEYTELLTRSRNLTMLPIDEGIAARAAEIRARYGLRTPDAHALQVSAALSAGCQALLTNDSRFRRLTELRALVLDDLEL